MFTFTKQMTLAGFAGLTLFAMGKPAAYAQSKPPVHHPSPPPGHAPHPPGKAKPPKPKPGSHPHSKDHKPGWRKHDPHQHPGWFGFGAWGLQGQTLGQGGLPYGLGAPGQLAGLPGGPGDGAGASGQSDADLLRAYGDLMRTQQESYLAKEQVEQERQKTRMLKVDADNYIEANTPTPEDRREQRQLEVRRRAMTNPPVTEIWSGKSLNDLLPLAQNQRRRGTFPKLALSEDVLERINVWKGKGGNLGMLKSDGELSWPQALREQAYAPMRTKLDRLTKKAVQTAKSSGKVDTGTLHDLNAGVHTLTDGLKRSSLGVAPPQYIEAKRFLNDLDECVTALGADDVAETFFHNEAIQGKSLTELIDYLTANGLRFAPAAAGDEPSYTALHQALVACVAKGTSTLTAKQ